MVSAYLHAGPACGCGRRGRRRRGALSCSTAAATPVLLMLRRHRRDPGTGDAAQPGGSARRPRGLVAARCAKRPRALRSPPRSATCSPRLPNAQEPTSSTAPPLATDLPGQDYDHARPTDCRSARRTRRSDATPTPTSAGRSRSWTRCVPASSARPRPGTGVAPRSSAPARHHARASPTAARRQRRTTRRRSGAGPQVDVRPQRPDGAMAAPTSAACWSWPRRATYRPGGRAAPGSATPARPALLAGSVTYDPPPIDLPAEGSVLVCCSSPTEEVVIDL